MAENKSDASGPISKFLQLISKSWQLTPVYTKIWGVEFSPSDKTGIGISERITTIFKKYLSSDDINKLGALVKLSNNPYTTLDSSKTKDTYIDVTKAVKTFALANKIEIPGESVWIGSTNQPEQEYNSGFISGRYAGGRINDANRNVKISFLDTNAELLDLLIRPWIIALSYRGLIETSDTSMPSLKCDITASFFAKSGPDSKVSVNGDILTSKAYYPKTYKKTGSIMNDQIDWQQSNYSITASKLTNADEPYLRKQVIFRNCVPTSIPEKHFNYGVDMSDNEVITDISFSYDYYEIVYTGTSEKNKDIVAHVSNVTLDNSSVWDNANMV